MKKLAERYMVICAKAYTGWEKSKLVHKSSFREEVDFHNMHLELIKRAAGGEERGLLDERYPFLKIGGVWHISLPKLYLYLFGAKRILASFEDKSIQRVHDGVQAASYYYDQAQELEDLLRPRTHEDYLEYQKQLTILYENHLSNQLCLFGEPTPV